MGTRTIVNVKNRAMIASDNPAEDSTICSGNSSAFQTDTVIPVEPIGGCFEDVMVSEA